MLQQPAPAPMPYPRPRRPVLVPHVIWEGVLLLAVIGVIIVVVLRTSVDGGVIMWQIGFAGLLASALALSLRTGGPNLAIPGAAAMSGALHAEFVGAQDWPPLLSLLVTMAAVVVFGAVLGLVAGLTSVPWWAVSLAGLAATQAVVFGLTDASGTVLNDQLPAALSSRAGWFSIFLSVTLGGGVLFAVPAVRRLAGPDRTTADRPRFSGAGLARALVGFVGSSALAGLAGVAFVNEVRAFHPGVLSIQHLLLALGAVLLGGVSAFGGRGGIAGTALGTALLSVVMIWINFEVTNTSLRQLAVWVVIGAAILVGIGVSRAMEAIAPAAPDGVLPPPTRPLGPAPAAAAGPALPSATRLGPGTEPG